MARSFSNAKRISSFLSDQISVTISKRGIAAGTHGAQLMNTGGVTGAEVSSKPISRVPEFKSNQVESFSAKIPSLLSFSNKFSTVSTPISNPVVSHARPLSPHLSIYKPQSSSMFSISNRIAASFLSGVALLFYMMCMKTGLICFTFNSFYQLFFSLAGFTGLICYSSIPLIALHILHAVKH